MAEEAALFGGRLRERRKELNLTQREVADRVKGKTEGKDISRYERGEHLPGQDTRVALAEALGTTLADLYSGPQAEREDQPAAPDLMEVLNGNGATQPQVADRLDLIEAKLNEVLDQVDGLRAGQVAAVAELSDQLAAIADRAGRVEDRLAGDG